MSKDEQVIPFWLRIAGAPFLAVSNVMDWWQRRKTAPPRPDPAQLRAVAAAEVNSGKEEY